MSIGEIVIAAICDGNVTHAAVLRTARKLFDGIVFGRPYDSGVQEGHE